MAATDSHAHDMPCPDPSVHEKPDRLSAQASTAALYVTQPQKGLDPREPKEDVLGKDGKLSSKGAAASLKYARATDLPSFPSHGGDSNAAGAAAMLAKDYKMKDLWQPEQSMAGSQAAMKAQKDGGKLDLWQYEGSKNGLSAATLAMRKNTQSPLSPNIDRGYTETGKNNSLLAATKSAKSSRQRAGSMPAAPPPQYPDEKNSARNALNAATVSHRNSVRAAPTKVEGWNSEANQAARIKNSHMDKEMFGSSPPVEPEVEERKREAALRASAVSMAKKMYDVQNRARLQSEDPNLGQSGAETAHRRNASNISQPDLKQEAMKYITLQDQAHKLAQERLAKVDKDMENSKYREYYGYSDKSPRKSRLSMRGRTRNRASSEGAERGDSDDEEQARRIRTQMSQLNTASNTVSDKQRDEDRARLLKAAEKRVHDRMHDMDEKVFQETGKPSQAMMDDWETKAREKAEKDRAEREKHPGKTHIGGGKYMDQSEIEAIAATRLKSTFAELDDNAAKRRERDAEIQRRRDQAETERMEEKMRQDQQKAEFKRIKDQDKATARKEKEERKAAQREEKARKSEDKRKSREIKREPTAAAGGGAVLGEKAAAAGDDMERADEPQTDVKDKRKSRGMLGRLTDKFKKDDKPAAEKEEQKTGERSSKDASEAAAASTSVGGATSSSGAERATAEKDSLYDVSSRDAEGAREVESAQDNRSSTAEHEDTSHGSAAAAAAAGTAGAGGLAWATTRSHPPQIEDEASSLSSSDDGRDLQQVETAHSMQPLQSPAIEKRPDLERHISTIDTSSGEESGSDDLPDSSDDEDEERGRQGGPGFFASSSKAEETPAAEKPVSPPGEGEKRKEGLAIPVLSPAPKEKEDETPATTEVKTEPAATSSTTRAEPAASQAPTVATGPSAAETSKTKTAEKDDKEKEKRSGFRGLLSRLTHRDNKESESGGGGGKLHKNRTSSEQQQQDKGFQGGAKYTSPQKKEDGESAVTPVTTTSAGKTSAEGAATDSSGAHMGTDGPIGEVPAPARAASTASASSFQRHDAQLRDPDEVSSSGAEEEDVERGRTGRMRKKFGLGSGKQQDDAPATATTERKESDAQRESSEQFEEARDHFDESLAPPAAFAGQPKSQSPIRESKFAEEL